jgi:formylmethanofuran dehydrogenase subunit C
MNKIKLTLREKPVVVLEAEVISPDLFVEQSNEEIRASVVYHGKRQKKESMTFLMLRVNVVTALRFMGI